MCDLAVRIHMQEGQSESSSSHESGEPSSSWPGAVIIEMMETFIAEFKERRQAVLQLTNSLTSTLKKMQLVTK